MSMVGLASAHGSPGVTTTALVLAATWPENRRCLLVEADPFGGVISTRYGLGDAPGLSSLTAAARGGLDEEVVWGHSQRLPGGLPVLVGPASADEAHAVLRDVAGILAAWGAAQSTVDVIVDCGRIAAGLPTVEVFAKADAAMVLARPSLEQLRLAAHRMASLEASDAKTSLLLIGDSPYGSDEVAGTLNATVAGVIAWDPRTAATLGGTRGAVRNLRRSPLVRSAATLAEGLASPPPGSSDSAPTAPHFNDGELEVAEEASG